MRFIQRNEFFGSLLYDRTGKDYFHLDHFATAILREPGRLFTEAELQNFEAEEGEIGEIRQDLTVRGMLGDTELRENRPVAGMLSAPTRVFYEITYQCPEKCRHCYTNSGAKDAGELALSEKLSIADQMVEISCYRVSIAGGDPLVDPDFFPFVEHALARGIDVSFSTSGIPITERTAQRLATLDIRTINISLDGWDEESYGKVRGHGRLPYVMRGVRNLRKHYRGKIAAKCTLMTTNILHLDRIIAFARELDFDVVKFNCVREAGRAGEAQSLIPSQDDYLAAMRVLAGFYNDRTSPIKMVLPVNPYQKLDADAPDIVGELGFGCYAGKESFCINPVGDIQPCSSFGRAVHVDGNVRSTRLIDAWLQGHAMKLFRGLNGSSACQGCRSYAGCRGGCYLRSLTAYGDFNATDPYCYERKNDPAPVRWGRVALPVIQT